MFGTMGENLESARRRIASGSSVGHLKVDSNTSLDRLGTASPVSWDSLFQNLSAALPVIFHTPAPNEMKEELTDIEPRHYSEHHLNVEPNPFGLRLSASRGSLTSIQRKRPLSGNGGQEAEGDIGLGRLLRVRHEETEEKLNQSLTMICRPKSPKAPSQDNTDGGGGSRAAGLRLKESLKSGVRVKLDVSQYDLNDIVVSVSKNKVLSVYVTKPEKKTLHTLQLLENPRIESFACSIVDGNSLYIRQRSKDAMVLEHNGHMDKFLPVIKLDETSLRFTVVIHIPEEIMFEDVVVKTVDETLVIKGQQSLNRPIPGHSRTSFMVVMALPEGADNRSVSARMVDFQQVVIEGSLGLASRRMTCNF